MANVITKEQTKDFISRAYKTACGHGFHETELSVEHYLMLVLSEIGEAVEADRKGRGCCDLGIFDDALRTSDFTSAFNDYVKDSLPDELADVCIRLYDMCGAFDVVPDYLAASDMRDTFNALCKDMSFCERCFMLSCLLCRCDDLDTNSLSSIIGCALTFILCMATDMGMDLVRHIELKMQYNETRPVMHGKRY